MRNEGVPLTELAAAASSYDPRVLGAAVAVADLHHDSRRVGAGDGFVAIVGENFDGHDFIDGAIDRGAVAIVAERESDVAVAQLLVSDTRMALPVLAATVHHHPSRDLAVVGVTGTNGKTTVTYMLEAIAVAAGRRPGVVGTVGARIVGSPVPVMRTTPEASDLQRLLREMVDGGVDMVALEVSSHALMLGRADAIAYDVAAFTNLSRDHLDFHGTMERYAEAKARLFAAGRARRAVIWIDDPMGAKLAARTSLPTTTVGFTSTADVSGQIVAMSAAGSVVEVSASLGSFRFEVGLAGRFNAANALVAAACALELGMSADAVVTGLGRLAAIPGRFELIGHGMGYMVIVDYAHTPEAIAGVVAAARDLSSGRVVTVVGAGGDRDAAKRPAMGAAAALADIAVITSDNPRSEDPAAIMAAVAAGAAGSGAEVLLEADRAAAIQIAIDAAGPGDVVLILGKGHEQGQEVGGAIVPFDDREIAGSAIAARSGR